MRRLIRIFFLGMFISFLGTLPLSTLNVAAMQIAISDGYQPAILFAVGVFSAEMVYVRLSLVALDWIRKQQKLMLILEWATLFIILALAAATFYAALHPSENENFILSSNINKYLLGLMMSAVNPMQIPFWFGWSTVLFSKKVLLPRNDNYNTYIAGIGLGTFAGHCVFIFGGKLIADKINANQTTINWFIGGIFLVTAAVQVWKMLRKKDPQHQLEHPEELTKKFEEQLDEIQKQN